MAQAVSGNFPRTREDGLILMEVAPADDVTIGDHMFRDISLAPDAVRPAGQLADSGNLLQNQQRFAKLFVGVAVEGKRTTDLTKLQLLVDTSPVAEYRRTVATGTFEVGSFLAPAAAAGTVLDDQVLAVVTGEKDAIYVVARRITGTQVQVRMLRGQGSSLSLGHIIGQSTIRTLAGTLDLTANSDHADLFSLDPDGAVRNMDLPAASLTPGRVLLIKNFGAATEIITVREPGPTTVVTIDGLEGAVVWSDGTNWRGFIGVQLT